MSDKILEKSPDGRFTKSSKVVGTGAYKKVYQAYDTSLGKQVAWNSIYTGNLSEKNQDLIYKEISTLEKFHNKCPFIIKFYGSWFNEKVQEIVFITELGSSGSIREFRKEMEEIKMKAIKRWFYQIMKGIEFLHDNNIIHRDLKADNIFINGTTGNILIGDFGLSLNYENYSNNSVIGTPEFMAPEMLDGKYDNKVDIYAFGMTLLEIITDEPPYSECSVIGQVLKRKINGELPKSIDKIDNIHIKEIVTRCLSFNPKERYTIKELLNVDFFRNRQDNTEIIKNKLESEILSEENHIQKIINDLIDNVFKNSRKGNLLDTLVKENLDNLIKKIK